MLPDPLAVAHPQARRDAAITSGLLLVAVYLGSGGLAHFDFVLTGYCAATLVAAFAVAYRVSLFWRRRPSAFYGRALARALLHPRHWFRVMQLGGRDIAAQQVIARRGWLRWAAHMLLSWGTLVSFAVTLPLVWGWLHFEAVGSRAYTVVVFSLPLGRFSVDGLLGWLVFHTLNLAAGAVMLGGSYFLMLRLRLRRHGGVATQFHLGPILLLLVVAATGLLLPVTSHWGPPWMFRCAAVAHEAAVVALLVALPYGKLIHVFIRPLHLGAQMVRATPERTACESCGTPLAPTAQLAAVETMLRERGFAFRGYQRRCGSCRRRHLASIQTHLFGARFQPHPIHRRPAAQEAA